MSISIALVKKLREVTNIGMLDCKKALIATEGDLKAAVHLMRQSGKVKAEKRAKRVVKEGLINITISQDSKIAIILEVNSETDFVAKNKIFIDFVTMLGKLALAKEPKNIDEFIATTNDIDIDKLKADIINQTGENINIRRVQTMKAGNDIIGHYKHNNRIAVLVRIVKGNPTLAKDIAMHIAASKPKCVSKHELAYEFLMKEKAIFTTQAKELGKADAIIEKIVNGRMEKLINEITLYGQPFVKDLDVKVFELMQANNAKVDSFIRFEVGEA